MGSICTGCVDPAFCRVLKALVFSIERMRAPAISCGAATTTDGSISVGADSDCPGSSATGLSIGASPPNNHKRFRKGALPGSMETPGIARDGAANAGPPSKAPTAFAGGAVLTMPVTARIDAGGGPKWNGRFSLHLLGFSPHEQVEAPIPCRKWNPKRHKFAARSRSGTPENAFYWPLRTAHQLQ